jgi:hypothetical protein
VLQFFGVVFTYKLGVTDQLLQLARSALGSGHSFESTAKLVRELHMEEYWRRRNAYASYVLSWRNVVALQNPNRFGEFEDPSGYAGKSPNAKYLVSMMNRFMSRIVVLCVYTTYAFILQVVLRYAQYRW